MVKKLFTPPNRIGLIIFAFTFILIPISCRLFSTAPSHYDNPAFSFDYPSSWQTMKELWGFEQLNANYYNLGFQEIIMVTSVHKKGEFGAYFAVASMTLPEDESVDSIFHRTYGQIEGEIREASETITKVNGQQALTMNYERPWGEPWWRFSDVWLEKDGIIYLLSFHCLGSIEKYQEDLDFMLNSFSFK